MQYPRQRVDELVITRTGDETIVYDRSRHELHTLKVAAALVWDLCDGSTVEGIIEKSKIEQNVVIHALNQLSEAHLIEAYDIPTAERTSRRKMIQRAGIVAVPLVVSTTMPVAAHHQSGKCHQLGELRNLAASTEECCRFECEMVLGGNYSTCGGVAN